MDFHTAKHESSSSSATFCLETTKHWNNMSVQHRLPPPPSLPLPRPAHSQLRRWRVIIRLPGNQTMLYFLPGRDVIQVDPWVTAILFMWVRIWGPIWCHRCWTWWDQMERSLLMSGQLQLPEVFFFSLFIVYLFIYVFVCFMRLLFLRNWEILQLRKIPNN